MPRTYVVNDLNGEEIVGTFTTKNCKKQIKKKLKLKKQSRKNAVNHMLSERDTVICLIAGYIKNTWYKCFNIFQNQYL